MSKQDLIAMLVRIADRCLKWAHEMSPSKPFPAVRIAIVAGKPVQMNEHDLKGSRTMIDTSVFELLNTEQVELTLVAENVRNKPATLDPTEPPTWETSDATLATLEPAEDGLTALAIAGGGIGEVEIVATGDADLGTGVRPIIARRTLRFKAGEATAVGINVGTPVPIA